MVCFSFVIRFQQATNNVHLRGQGVDPYTYILGNNRDQSSLSQGTHVNIIMLCIVSESENANEFSITLLCIVGVDGCTEQSTGISSGGLHSTIATPTVGHTTSPREESSIEGRHDVILLIRYHSILEIWC